MSDQITIPRSELMQVQELAAIVRSSDDAIIGKTLEGVVTSWNAAAERIYGYTPAEMIGRPISLLAPPGLEDEVTEMLVKVKAGEQVAHHETRRRRKDGALLDVSLTISPHPGCRGAGGRGVPRSDGM